MKMKVELTPREKVLVRTMEERLDITLEKVYIENGIRVWEWKANDGCELTRILYEIFGNGKKKR